MDVEVAILALATILAPVIALLIKTFIDERSGKGQH